MSSNAPMLTPALSIWRDGFRLRVSSSQLIGLEGTKPSHHSPVRTVRALARI